MPMGYETLVGDMGSSLSGGQKQRVLLARAFYRQAKLLVIDEGTSHVDAAREASINDEISTVDVTRIVVAHRKETIDRSKYIYLMESGGISKN
jgi:ATP-binding cassette subfamily B protein RaxB